MVRGQFHRSLLGALLAVPVLLMILSIWACLPVPIGDPEKSKVDPKLTGAWLQKVSNEDEVALFVVSSWDARTFLVQRYGCKLADGAVEPGQTGTYKAWLTELGGATFITLEPQAVGKTLNLDKKDTIYLIGKVAVKDDAATVEGLNPESELIKGIKTREDAEKVLKEHANDAAIFAKEPLNFRKAGEADKDRIKKILDAFHTE